VTLWLRRGQGRSIGSSFCLVCSLAIVALFGATKSMAGFRCRNGPLGPFFCAPSSSSCRFSRTASQKPAAFAPLPRYSGSVLSARTATSSSISLCGASAAVDAVPRTRSLTLDPPLREGRTATCPWRLSSAAPAAANYCEREKRTLDVPPLAPPAESESRFRRFLSRPRLPLPPRCIPPNRQDASASGLSVLTVVV
jgi:hypothetical protein